MTTPPLPVGYRHTALDSVGSTNEAALAAARDGDPGRLWITAREQTAGRGRRGRTWTSPPGNLYASLLLVDIEAAADAAGTISFVAAVALDRALADIVGAGAAERLSLKWPNDVLCDGRKVAGILVEDAGLGGGRRATVVGMGVNCRTHPPIAGSQPAGNLAELGMDVGPDALFPRIAVRMADELCLWDSGRNFDRVRARWLERSAGVGAPVRVTLAGGDIEGAFETVDSVGRLVLRQRDGSQRVLSSGDASVRLSRGTR